MSRPKIRCGQCGSTASYIDYEAPRLGDERTGRVFAYIGVFRCREHMTPNRSHSLAHFDLDSLLEETA